ncbi:hypothetical protein ABWH96_06075 [Marivirga tractuosa]|uniref:hypothetical protein n=1 Tax=Marivirga tractuosa TaxID=1006 RepID=UPI0035CF9C43
MILEKIKRKKVIADLDFLHSEIIKRGGLASFLNQDELNQLCHKKVGEFIDWNDFNEKAKAWFNFQVFLRAMIINPNSQDHFEPNRLTKERLNEILKRQKKGFIFRGKKVNTNEGKKLVKEDFDVEEFIDSLKLNDDPIIMLNDIISEKQFKTVQQLPYFREALSDIPTFKHFFYRGIYGTERHIKNIYDVNGFQFFKYFKEFLLFLMTVYEVKNVGLIESMVEYESFLMRMGIDKNDGSVEEFFNLLENSAIESRNFLEGKKEFYNKNSSDIELVNLINEIEVGKFIPFLSKPNYHKIYVIYFNEDGYNTINLNPSLKDKIDAIFSRFKWDTEINELIIAEASILS